MKHALAFVLAFSLAHTGSLKPASTTSSQVKTAQSRALIRFEIINMSGQSREAHIGVYDCDGSSTQESSMSKVRVAGFGMSIDGFSAGLLQNLNDPLGQHGMEIFKWFFRTRTFCAMHGKEGGSVDLDDQFAHRGMENFGAFILGRNMFGPIRGPWPDDTWKGWWGENPPYHAPTFVLTHYEREPLVMNGGTTFHFVTGGIEEALRLARHAAGTKDVKIGGGVATVRQYLMAGLVDSLHLAVSPVALGRGEALLTGLDLRELGFQVTEHQATEHATHIVLERGLEQAF